MIETIVLDKTGTVTKGEPALTDVVPQGDITKEELLKMAASAEKHSEHPLAEAIVKGAEEEHIDLIETTDFESVPGAGIQVTWEGEPLYIGTRKLMKQQNIEIGSIEEKMTELEAAGKTAMLIGYRGALAGMVAVADTVKETSKEAIERLHEQNLEVILLTGDNERTAQAIAKEVGVDRVIAEVLPGQKADEIKRLQQEGKKVAMVGDGINDAPALAIADIGMAIGTGTDVAIEAADVTLMRGDLHSVADSIELSAKTMRNIKQNLFFAFAYNSASIPVAAIGLLAPWVAGAAMACSSVSVVLNALRLQRLKLKREA